MDTVNIVTKASSAIPIFTAMIGPLLVMCVTVDAGSRMLDSHTTPRTIPASKGAAAAWKRKTAGKVAAIARASANPLRRVARLSAIAPAKSQTKDARSIQTGKATKYMNVAGKVPTPRSFPERAYITPNTQSTKCGVTFGAERRFRNVRFAVAVAAAELGAKWGYTPPARAMTPVPLFDGSFLTAAVA
jgi:hypothetical protein